MVKLEPCCSARSICGGAVEQLSEIRDAEKPTFISTQSHSAAALQLPTVHSARGEQHLWITEGYMPPRHVDVQEQAQSPAPFCCAAAVVHL